MSAPAAALVIRSYEPSDHASVVSLWKEVFPNEPAWNDPALIIRRKVRVHPHLLLVALSESAVVGTVIAGYDGVRGWVYHLAVDPSKRRRGIGRSLMHAAEVELLRLGCPKLNLQVRANNSSVVGFYRALGYAVEDRVSFGKPLDQAD